jgi:hypothetical protein
MKKRFRTFIAAVTGLALCACANPYINQIAELDARYAAGHITRSKYLAQRHELEVQKAQVDRENAGLALGVASVATAAAGVAVAADSHGGHGGPAPHAGGAPPR